MRIALAQINASLGGFKANADKILNDTIQAADLGCDLVVFPECSLMGYHPVDLLERASIVKEQLKEFNRLQREIPKGISVLLGLITENKSKFGKPFFNSAALITKGKRPQFFNKQLLPTYDVFDEGRYIESGDVRENLISLKGRKILITICEDIWGWKNPVPRGRVSVYKKNPLEDIRAKSVDLVLNLSASPFSQKKLKMRENVCLKTVEHFKAPLVYVNMVGAQDEIIFDGGSQVYDARGKLVLRSKRFEEDLQVYDLEKKNATAKKSFASDVQILKKALVLGLQDFVTKNGFQKVHLGLSGGIDSGVVACLAAEALGPKAVTALALPSEYTSELSLELAKKLADRLQIDYLQIPIASIYDVALKEIAKPLDHHEFNLVNENLQARLRSVLLMTFANKYSSLLLGTSNKSELTMGYATLYGDMSSGLMVIGDLLKREVYALAEEFNREQKLIPTPMISRPPSAELRPGQKDSDSLPAYDVLDGVVEDLVVKMKPASSPLKRRVIEAMMKSEFKRWQAPPILRVSEHAFGRGRRFPIAHRAFF